jgi:2-polyprenyl-3-methyl-5-hydroxy-6-metoxy-1,4-benzoquinol methylase
MPNYGDPTYWEDRYKNQTGKTFDWLEDYETLKSIMNDFKISKEEIKVLNLGCGNAVMSEDMYKDGYKLIYNIDISENVIYQMKQRNSDNEMICNVIFFIFISISLLISKLIFLYLFYFF